MDQNLLFSSELFSKGYGFMPKLVAKDQDLSIEAKAIYSYLASYSGAGLSSFPSTSLILHDLGISENRYLKHRKTLVDKGYLTIKRERLDNGFSKNIYIINQNPSEVVHLNSVHLQNVGIGNVGIGNEGTISNSFKSNNINSNSNNKKILSSSDEQDDNANLKESNLDKLKSDFELIWAEYPKSRRKDKQKCFTKYKNALKDGDYHEDILAGLMRYKKEIAHKQTANEFIRLSSTWFNNKNWNDDYDIGQQENYSNFENIDSEWVR